jgi:hypothetical protein
MKPERLIIKIKAYQETTSIEAQKYFGSIKFRDIKVVRWRYGSRICWGGLSELENQFSPNS